MSDETTVDKNAKLLFNLGYQLSQQPDTNEVLKKMIGRAKDDVERTMLENGKRQFTKDAIAGQDITRKRERTESEVLKEYYDGMEAAYQRGEWAGIGHAPDELLQEPPGKYKSPADEKQLAGQQPESERVGQGPALSDAQKKELSDFEASQRAKEITREAKKAAAIQRMKDDEERRERERDRGRGRG